MFLERQHLLRRGGYWKQLISCLCDEDIEAKYVLDS
jgi:hypothetical protein